MSEDIEYEQAEEPYEGETERFNPLDQFFQAYAAGFRQGVDTSDWIDAEIWPEFVKWLNEENFHNSLEV